MLVFPAIDLLFGHAVRLRQGRYDDVTVYSREPAEVAASMRGEVPILHVVDLEGARAGKPMQDVVIRAIAEALGGALQIGGGVRSMDAIEAAIAIGASRVVLGTAAIKDPALLREAAQRHPGRIVVALDAKDGKVATDGWEVVSDLRAIDVARSLGDLPVAAILYTDVARDGTEVGPNVEATAALASATSIPVLASGGVGSLDHLRALAKIPGVEGAIVGRALYERKFTLREAIDASRDSAFAGRSIEAARGSQ